MASFFEFHEKIVRQKKADAAPPTSGPAEAQTVAQLTARIERALKDGLPGSVLVRGELSNTRLQAQSGHLYFTLKDAKSCIDCVMFRSDAKSLRFEPRDGLEAVAAGRVSVYAPRGRYQLTASTLHPVGQGALELALRQLQQKLQAEGLFAPQRKRPLPKFPARVVLVTSQNTAALQDMLKVLRRFPWVMVRVYHVPVQGKGSAERIAGALRHINIAQAGDVILLARGGGSLEDLWEFNEEAVARAIFDSAIPVITGIGHEIDVSIADLVADYHAHTPTEAAQVVTAGWKAIQETIDRSDMRLARSLRAMVQTARQRLAAIERHETFRRPVDRVDRLNQLVDDRERSMQLAMSRRLGQLHRRVNDLSMRLDAHRPQAVVQRLRDTLASISQRMSRAMSMQMAQHREKISRAQSRLSERHPRHAITFAKRHLEGTAHQLQLSMLRDLRTRRSALDAMHRHLQAIGPDQVLARGYSITTLKKTGIVVRSKSQVKPEDVLMTRVGDGVIESTAEDAQQPKLFEQHPINRFAWRLIDKLFVAEAKSFHHRRV